MKRFCLFAIGWMAFWAVARTAEAQAQTAGDSTNAGEILFHWLTESDARVVEREGWRVSDSIRGWKYFGHGIYFGDRIGYWKNWVEENKNEKAVVLAVRVRPGARELNLANPAHVEDLLRWALSVDARALDEISPGMRRDLGKLARFLAGKNPTYWSGDGLYGRTTLVRQPRGVYLGFDRFGPSFDSFSLLPGVARVLDLYCAAKGIQVLRVDPSNILIKDPSVIGPLLDRNEVIAAQPAQLDRLRAELSEVRQRMAALDAEEQSLPRSLALKLDRLKYSDRALRGDTDPRIQRLLDLREREAGRTAELTSQIQLREADLRYLKYPSTRYAWTRSAGRVLLAGPQYVPRTQREVEEALRSYVSTLEAQAVVWDRRLREFETQEAAKPAGLMQRVRELADQDPNFNELDWKGVSRQVKKWYRTVLQERANIGIKRTELERARQQLVQLSRRGGQSDKGGSRQGIVHRETMGAATFTAAYLVKEGVNALLAGDPEHIEEAAREMATPEFLKSMAVFTGASRVTQGVLALKKVEKATPRLAKGLTRTVLPMAAGMVAMQALSGRLDAKDAAISTGSYVGVGAGIQALTGVRQMDRVIRAACQSAGARGKIALGAYTVGQLAATLFFGERIDNAIHAGIEQVR